MNSTSLPPQFEQELQERTDIELLDVLAHPDDYVPEAIEAVKKEVQRRRLEPTRSLEADTGLSTPGTESKAEVASVEPPQDDKSLADPSLSLMVVAMFRN